MDESQAAQRPSTFAELEAQSLEALAVKLEAHRFWLEVYDHWTLDQDEGVLVVHSQANGAPIVARAPAQITGTFNKANGTWLWGWDNPSIQEHLKADARRVQQLGAEKSFEELTTRKLEMEPADALKMAAIAAHACGAQGVFSAAAGDTVIYMNFGKVSLQKVERAEEPAGRSPAKSSHRLQVLLIILVVLVALPFLAVLLVVLGFLR